MRLTMLGTGNALVTECYNTCYHKVTRLRHLSNKEKCEQKQKLLSLAVYARQITFMVKYGIRTMEDLNGIYACAQKILAH
ncbi:MAG: hypothetical protein ACSW8A_08415 [Lachnospiraceae bacterium]